MSRRQLRIRVDGRITDDTAAALGMTAERVEDRDELVAAYVDQAQLTGLLVHLADLHISYDRIEVLETESCGT